jgi:hypothetical protein
MKTLATLIGLSLLALPADAQEFLDESYPPAPPEETFYATPPEVPASIVYTAPVVYHAPVMYEVPVVYYGPVYYAAPIPDYPQSPPDNPADWSSVIFIGGPNPGELVTAAPPVGASTVHVFGREEAVRRGKLFGYRR